MKNSSWIPPRYCRSLWVLLWATCVCFFFVPIIAHINIFDSISEEIAYRRRGADSPCYTGMFLRQLTLLQAKSYVQGFLLIRDLRLTLLKKKDKVLPLKYKEDPLYPNLKTGATIILGMYRTIVCTRSK